jgi:predicted lipoprotein with Yx(FWY)xxD motif
MPKLSAPLVVLVSAVVFAGCGSSSSSSTSSSTSAATTTAAGSSPSSPGVKISAASVSGLGTVLVNGQGHTLYTFAPDKDSKVTCVGVCATVWPPVRLPSGAKPVAEGGVNASLLGSDPDPSGGRVVTYKGWPLYTYVTDTSAGSASGQGVQLNGGVWYVISTSGAVVTKKASSGAGGY